MTLADLLMANPDLATLRVVSFSTYPQPGKKMGDFVDQTNITLLKDSTE
jgi:hypothetical protein